MECYEGVTIEGSAGTLARSGSSKQRTGVPALPPEHYRVEKMKFAKTRDPETNKSINDKTTVFYDAHITLRDIPEEAYAYVVNGKPAFEWVMERQSASKDNVQRHPQRHQPLGHRDDGQSQVSFGTFPPRHHREPGDDEDRGRAAEVGYLTAKNMSDELPPPPSTPETKPPCRHLFKRISTWYDWEGAENEQWYFKGSCSDRWFGSRWFHTSAAIFFFVLGVVLPLLLLSFSGSAQTAIDTVSRHFLISFIWLATTTLALPLFIWCERLAFDDWVGKIDDRKQKKKLTARFELNSKHMEVFWKTVAGIYAAAGLFTLAQKAESTKNPMQDDIKALTAALNRIADVESRKTRSDDARNSDNQKSASGEIKKTSLDEAGVTDSGRTNEVQAPPATPPSGNKTKP